MARALRASLLLLAGVAAGGARDDDADGDDDPSSRCGTDIGLQRGKELALGEHLLALARTARATHGCPTGEGTPCSAATVLSRSPPVVSVSLAAAAAGSTSLLEALQAAQPSNPEREDGWQMSPKGAATDAVTSALASTVRRRATCSHMRNAPARAACAHPSSTTALALRRWAPLSTFRTWSRCRLSELPVLTPRSTTTTLWQQRILHLPG